MTSTNSTDNNLATPTMIGKLCELITTMQKNHDEQIAELRKTQENQQKAHEEHITLMRKTHDVLDTRLTDLQYTNRYLMELNRVKYTYTTRGVSDEVGSATLANIHKVSHRPAVDDYVNWTKQCHGTYIKLVPGVEHDVAKHGVKRGYEFVNNATKMKYYKEISLTEIFDDRDFDKSTRGSWTESPVYVTTGILPETQNHIWIDHVNEQRRDISKKMIDHNKKVIGPNKIVWDYSDLE